MPRKQWRCFHCDEVFTNHKAALDHFGLDEGALPACRIAAHHSHLVTYIRDLEAQLEQYRDEDSHIARAMMALECDQAQKLRTAEEEGYGRGVRDMKALLGRTANSLAVLISETPDPGSEAFAAARPIGGTGRKTECNGGRSS